MCRRIILFRVLNVRSHKNYCFFDTVSVGEVSQAVISQKKTFKIECGDVVCADGTWTKNKYGDNIFEIEDVIYIKHGSCAFFSKGIRDRQNDYRKASLYSALNGGEPVRIKNCEETFLCRLEDLMRSLSYKRTRTYIVENHQTTSSIKPAFIRNDIKERCLRITVENQLRQMCAITLDSYYAIGNMFRDMGTDRYHSNEFCSMECISPYYQYSDIPKLIQRIHRLMSEVLIEYGFESSLEEEPVSIEYDELMKNAKDRTYSAAKRELKSAIIINVPVTSPFVKEINGCRKEIQWIVNGRRIGHGYSDETKYDMIKKHMEMQALNNGISNVSIPDYYKLALPDTVSFGLGIDRLFKEAFMLTHIVNAINPLGISY